MEIMETEWARLQEIIDELKGVPRAELFSVSRLLHHGKSRLDSDQIQVCFTYGDGIDSEIRCSLFKNSTGECYWEAGRTFDELKDRFKRDLDILPEKSVAQLRVEAAQAELDAAIKAMEGKES